MGIDFEEDSKQLPTNNEIQDISKLVKLQFSLQAKVVEAETALKRAKEAYARIALKELPEAMKAAGMNTFTTDNGVTVGLKEDLYASISEKNKAAAYKWLVENQFGDIIKTKVDLAFGRGEEKRVIELLRNLEETGFDNFTTSESIHGGTLKAFLKEQIEKGTEVPLELFGAYQFKEAILK